MCEECREQLAEWDEYLVAMCDARGHWRFKRHPASGSDARFWHMGMIRFVHRLTVFSPVAHARADAVDRLETRGKPPLIEDHGLAGVV